mmetsp:Transcript_65126/g.160362  ORF Transcript_65126/g.160362 Transcript_65126/m.160362 type:complete len:247 (-) Transcript_65126:361-1101(-)
MKALPSIPPVAKKGSGPKNDTASTASSWCLRIDTTLAVGSASAPPYVILVSIAVLSSLPVSTKSSFVSQHVTDARWNVPAPLGSCTVTRHWPSLGLHKRALQSCATDTTCLPSGVNLPSLTAPLCPLKTAMQLPDGTLHIHTDMSVLPASTTSPLVCHCTHRMSSDGPSSDTTGAPSSTFQTLTAPSMPAVARYVPDALKATSTTVSVCPESVERIALPDLLQMPAVSSPLAVAMMSGLVGCTATA